MILSNNILVSQKFADFNHYYSISRYYVTLDFLDSINYKLKTSMYGDSYILGTYEINNDTLELNSHSVIGKYIDKESVKYKFLSRAFKKSLIKDSLLLPYVLLNYNQYATRKHKDENDSLIYFQSDHHVIQSISIKKNGVYRYYGRSDIGPPTISDGTYKIINKKIHFTPIKDQYILNWFSSEKVMYFLENFLIGKRKKEGVKDCFVYYLKIENDS